MKKIRQLGVFLNQNKLIIGGSIFTLAAISIVPTPVKAICIIDTIERVSEVVYGIASPNALHGMITRDNSFTSPKTLFWYSLSAVSAASLAVCGAIKNVKILKALK